MRTLSRPALSAAAAVIVCAGCAALGYNQPIDSTATVASPNDAYFVVGVQPQNIQLQFDAGTVSNGKFSIGTWRSLAFMRPVDSGYIVARVHAGDTIGITKIVESSSLNVFGAIEYTPCSEIRTVVFSAPAGKVVYVGSITYASRNGALVPSYSNNIDAARAFVRKRFPMLADKVEQGDTQTMPTTLDCGFRPYER